jgi:hypothetical protein
VLVVKHQHGVTVDRFPDCTDHRCIDRLTEVHTADLADKERMKLP